MGQLVCFLLTFGGVADLLVFDFQFLPQVADCFFVDGDESIFVAEVTSANPLLCCLWWLVGLSSLTLARSLTKGFVEPCAPQIPTGIGTLKTELLHQFDRDFTPLSDLPIIRAKSNVRHDVGVLCQERVAYVAGQLAVRPLVKFRRFLLADESGDGRGWYEPGVGTKKCGLRLLAARSACQ